MRKQNVLSDVVCKLTLCLLYTAYFLNHAQIISSTMEIIHRESEPGASTRAQIKAVGIQQLEPVSLFHHALMCFSAKYLREFLADMSMYKFDIAKG